MLTIMKCTKTKKLLRVLWKQNAEGYYLMQNARVISEGERIPKEYGKRTARFANFECPECKTNGWIQCECGKFSCWPGTETVTCPWCGITGKIQKVDEFTVPVSD